MHVIAPQAARQFGVFTTEQAHASGWSDTQLARAVRRSELLRLRRSAYCLPSDAPTPDRLLGLQGVAAALRVTHSTVSHAASLSLYRLPLLRPPAIPCIVLPPPLRTREARLHVHRQQVRPSEIAVIGDVALTSAARSCVDYGREAGLAAAQVAADAALARGLTSQAELHAVYSAMDGRARWVGGATLAQLADGRSESPLESISRLAFADMTPAPEIQTVIRTPDGRFVARADFFWRELGVVGEADGRMKYLDGSGARATLGEADDRDALWREKQRESALARLGLLVVRWDWQLALQPSQLRRHVQATLAHARTLRSAGVFPTYYAA